MSTELSGRAEAERRRELSPKALLFGWSFIIAFLVYFIAELGGAARMANVVVLAISLFHFGICISRMKGAKRDADPKDEGLITDGFGNVWSEKCPECGGRMEVVRPGKVQCSEDCKPRSRRPPPKP